MHCTSGLMQPDFCRLSMTKHGAAWAVFCSLWAQLFSCALRIVDCVFLPWGVSLRTHDFAQAVTKLLWVRKVRHILWPPLLLYLGCCGVC